MRYKNASKNKENGVVYTPVRMADYVATEMLKYRPISEDGESISILDPAVGRGELLVSMIKAILPNRKHIIAVGYETDEAMAKSTQENLQKQFSDVEIDIRNADFLSAVETDKVGKYDYVIANPPYIRAQIMGSEKAQKIAKKLGLTGRIDIYYAFLIYTKNVLKDTGISGYITSNKLLTIKAGNVVRNYMLQNYQIHQVTDLGDTKLFTASVLPCIMLFSLGITKESETVKFTSVYEEHEAKDYTSIDDIFDAIYEEGDFKIPDGRCYKFQQGTIKSTNQNELWIIAAAENERWLNKVESNIWMTFADIGKIRVGIKTTADNVFIGDDWTGDKANLELLRPLITHRNAGQIVANSNSQWKVLYTHTTEKGKKVACNIEKYPKSKEYLLENYEQLSSRNYIVKANRNWYEIWVPQNPLSWEHRKIVFRDISEKPQFWIDETGAVVNGDCYWIDINNDVQEDVIYLALAIANSRFIEKYYDIKFNTKLYSGKRRYQTQYVAQFPIPYYNSELAQKAISLVKKIIAEGIGEGSSYKQKLDLIVDKLFS